MPLDTFNSCVFEMAIRGVLIGLPLFHCPRSKVTVILQKDALKLNSSASFVAFLKGVYLSWNGCIMKSQTIEKIFVTWTLIFMYHRMVWDDGPTHPELRYVASHKYFQTKGKQGLLVPYKHLNYI